MKTKNKLTYLIGIIFLSLGLVSFNAFSAIGDDARDAEQKRAQEELARMLAEIPILEDKSADWNVEQATFDYIVPCNDDQRPYSAIVAQGTNRKDLLTVKTGETEFTYKYDVAIGYERMKEFCIVIAQPKSGLSTVINENDVSNEYRTWWLTTGYEDSSSLVPFRDDTDEVDATIDLLKLAKEALKKPTYIVVGNDLGTLTIKIVQELRERDELDLIKGFIDVDRKTGEFIRYDMEGSVWKSEGKSVTNPPIVNP
jgi:hypothetical protein